MKRNVFPITVCMRVLSVFIFFIPFDNLLAEELPAVSKERIELYAGEVP